MAGELICLVAIGWRELDAPRHAKRAEPVLGPAVVLGTHSHNGRTRGHDKRGMTGRVNEAYAVGSGTRRDMPPERRRQLAPNTLRRISVVRLAGSSRMAASSRPR